MFSDHIQPAKLPDRCFLSTETHATSSPTHHSTQRWAEKLTSKVGGEEYRYSQLFTTQKKKYWSIVLEGNIENTDLPLKDIIRTRNGVKLPNQTKNEGKSEPEMKANPNSPLAPISHQGHLPHLANPLAQRSGSEIFKCLKYIEGPSPLCLTSYKKHH